MPTNPNLARVQFYGSPSAGLFSREIAESFEGVLTHNMVTDLDDPMVGFVSASIDGRPWTGTMWTRDAGVFLRELVHWGAIDQALLLAANLVKLVRPNPDGFDTFPEYFNLGQPSTGSELDGTGAIIIAMALLWHRLPPQHPGRKELAGFLTGPRSPINYILRKLENQPLIAGSGEFGGGCGVPGEFYNVVQNNLVRLALQAGASLAQASGRVDLSQAYRDAAARIAANMARHLLGEDGTWIWTVDPQTCKPDTAINEADINAGFGGLNGLLSMTADVNGLDPAEFDPQLVTASRKTFEKLLSFPKRRALFEKYGVWTQFDRHWRGYFTGASYGQGYAVQVMLLLDRLEMAQKGVDFLADRTYEPFPANHLDRESNFHFYERFYLPEMLESIDSINEEGDILFDGKVFDQGCGALNLVNVAEPLKIARLIVGLDDHDPSRPRIIPRLPPDWSGYEAENWPVLTAEGLIRVSIKCTRENGNLKIDLKAISGELPANFDIRLP